MEYPRKPWNGLNNVTQKPIRMANNDPDVVERYMTTDGYCFDDKEEATAHTKTVAEKRTLGSKEVKVVPTYHKEMYY